MKSRISRKRTLLSLQRERERGSWGFLIYWSWFEGSKGQRNQKGSALLLPLAAHFPPGEIIIIAAHLIFILISFFSKYPFDYSNLRFCHCWYFFVARKNISFITIQSVLWLNYVYALIMSENYILVKQNRTNDLNRFS